MSKKLDSTVLLACINLAWSHNPTGPFKEILEQAKKMADFLKENTKNSKKEKIEADLLQE